MSVYAYLFGANSIQSYIMLGGKVSEMVGASELVEEITATNGVLDDALETLGLKTPDDCYFSRRGGGTFYLLFKSEEKAKKLRDLLSLIISGFAPQLSFNHTIRSGCSDYEAIKKATAALDNLDSKPKIFLPEVGPLVRRAPRTGMPAICIKPDPDGQMLWVDAAANIKKLDRFSKGSKLTDKYLGNQPDEACKKYIFPRNLEKLADNVSTTNPLFPFSDSYKPTDYSTIGIVHADGNGLGEILQNLARKLENSEEYATIFLRLSDAINSATELAAQQAMQCIKEKSVPVQNGDDTTFVLPARPLILGGDDVTIIVRGDLALEFTMNYLQAFEKTSTEALADLHHKFDIIPATMTACAGVSFIKASQPFYQGYQLAESLCEHAKNRSREVRDNSDNLIPSSLTFHRVTTTHIDTYDERVKREMQVEIEEDNKIHNYSLTMGAYGVGNYADKLPQYKELEALVVLFAKDEISKGPLRHFQTLLSDNEHEAKRVWERWLSNLNKASNDNKKEYHSHASNLLQYENENCNLPFYQRKTNSLKQYSFIGDLYTCLAVQEGQQS